MKFLISSFLILVMLVAQSATIINSYVPPYPGDATKFLNGAGAFSTPAGGGGSVNLNPNIAVITDATGTNLASSSVTSTELAYLSKIASVSALSPSGTNVTVDFSSDAFRTVSLTTNALFSASNLGAGRRITLRVFCDSTTRSLYWPASWVPIGAPTPGSITASKYAEVELLSWGTTDANVTVKYAEQP